MKLKHLVSEGAWIFVVLAFLAVMAWLAWRYVIVVQPSSPPAPKLSPYVESVLASPGRDPDVEIEDLRDKVNIIVMPLYDRLNKCEREIDNLGKAVYDLVKGQESDEK